MLKCVGLFHLTIVSFALSISGCGNGGMADVGGTVTRKDGSPVVKARVTARSGVTGAWASAITDQEGRFELITNDEGTRVPAGDYQVTVIEDKGDWDHPNKASISAKYGQPNTSGITFSVEAGDRKDLNLELDPP